MLCRAASVGKQTNKQKKKEIQSVPSSGNLSALQKCAAQQVQMKDSMRFTGKHDNLFLQSFYYTALYHIAEYDDKELEVISGYRDKSPGCIIQCLGAFIIFHSQSCRGHVVRAQQDLKQQ